ncbi:MAG: ABC transporter ATP-binding protein [Clostridiales bacterium]|nr:ABC transporter ATP-binding protein [Clostridiales bacterium]
MNEVIKTIGLCKENILFDVNFSMEKGEMTAVMGPSGSGKSTLLYQLSGMDRPDGGQVIFGGEDICTYSEDMRADMRLTKMGFVFQQMNMLPNLSIIDNIILPAHQSQKIKKVNKKSEAGLRNEAVTLMNKVGIAGLEDRKITEVSGGQLQRACICRAIMNHPELLLADEPTGALNKASSEEIMEEFVRLNREGMSILIVTHDSKVASRCDRVCYMADGKISGEFVLGKYESSQKHDRELKINNWLEEHGW